MMFGKITLIGLGLLVLVFILFSGKMVENVDNSEIVIIQSVFTGKISICSLQIAGWCSS